MSKTVLWFSSFYCFRIVAVLCKCIVCIEKHRIRLHANSNNRYKEKKFPVYSSLLIIIYPSSSKIQRPKKNKNRIERHLPVELKQNVRWIYILCAPVRRLCFSYLQTLFQKPFRFANWRYLFGVAFALFIHSFWCNQEQQQQQKN